jgi:23S rRNA pseudouridine955/2504/2580 synthase
MIKSNLHTVKELENGLRIDRWFQRYFPNITHGRLQKLLRTGQVRVDGKRMRANDRLQYGQIVRLPPPHVLEALEQPITVLKFIPNPQDEALIRSLIIYQDDDLIAINKPSGLAVQGGTHVKKHIDGMLPYLMSSDGQIPLLVHRLDQSTSGVLLLAKHPYAANWLAQGFQTHTTKKIYWAVVVGCPQPTSGRIDLPLRKVRFGAIEKVIVDAEEGQAALTDYEVIENRANQISWLELRPTTGRTHQLRVHCLSLGTPILGDGKYGGNEAFPNDYALARNLPMHLHAREIKITKLTGETLTITAPLPAELQQTWENFTFFKQTA